MKNILALLAVLLLGFCVTELSAQDQEITEAKAEASVTESSPVVETVTYGCPSCQSTGNRRYYYSYVPTASAYSSSHGSHGGHSYSSPRVVESYSGTYSRHGWRFGDRIREWRRRRSHH